jgi:hypothetical protein
VEKKFNNQPKLKISSIVYLCISMLIYHDLHCLSPSPSLQKNKKIPAMFRFLPFPSSASPTPTSSATLPQLRPPRQLSLNSDLLDSSPYQSQKSALQDFLPKIPTVACLASRSSFFLHRSKFKSQNHKMVVFIKSVFWRHHPASCSRGCH